MGRPRKFDHDEARVLRQQGLSYNQIARRMGVSMSAIVVVVNEAAGLRQRAYHKEWLRRHSPPCIDCGTPTSHNSVRITQRCLACHRRHYAPSVRDTELRCYRCRQWLPDDQFYRSSHAGISPLRRGRDATCKTCASTIRKQRRHANKQPCVDCGAPTMGKTGRCVTCANRRKGNSRKPIQSPA